MNTVASIGVALKEADTQEYRDYAQQVIANAKAMADEFLTLWYQLVTWGTDNHMVILDLSDRDMNWAQAEWILDQLGISTSKSTIPDDPNPPFRPSGLRIGMPAMTTRGFDEETTREVVRIMDEAMRDGSKETIALLRKRVIEIARAHPLPE